MAPSKPRACVNLLQNGANYVILAKILGSIVGCLVDTGSSITLVNGAFLRQLAVGQKLLVHSIDKGIKVRFASGGGG